MAIYADAMRRDEGENERLKALVEGSDLASLVTSDHSDAEENKQATRSVEAEFRS